MDTQVTDLQVKMQEVRIVNEDKGWNSIPRTFGDDMALLHSEVSEALEAYRDEGLLIDGTAGERIGFELADVLIRLLDTCERYNVNLDRYYRLKMERNRTRPFRHGGKFL